MDIKTLNDFEKEIRTKIITKTNEDLARILLVNESELWARIKYGGYGWLKITEDKKARLFNLLRFIQTLELLLKVFEF